MGRQPSDNPRPKHRKGLWSPEEDQKLRNYIIKHGHGCWSSVPINAGLKRNGKSCRLRWINYLRPGLKHGMFTKEEEETVLTFHRMLGNKWSQIAQHLSGRTDNEVKNYWHSNLKKKVAQMEKLEVQSKPQEIASNSETLEYASTLTKNFTTQVPMQNSLFQQTENLSIISQAQGSYPPRVFFTEWLCDGGIYSYASGTSLKGDDHFQTSTNYYKSLNNFLLNEKICDGELYNAHMDDSSYDMLTSEFKLEGRNLERGFENLIHSYGIRNNDVFDV